MHLYTYNNLRRIASGLLALALLGGAVAQKQDDLAEKGPFEQRYFARQVGPAMKIPTPALLPQAPVEVMADKTTGETNELIVVLNYANANSIQNLLPAESKAALAAAKSPAAGLERAVLGAIQNKDRSTTAALFNPAYAYFAVNSDRLSDEDRLRGVELKATRERLDRYMILRYPSVAAARQAQLQMQKDSSVVVHSMNNALGTISAVPNDTYFSTPAFAISPYSDLKKQFQWGMNAMNFPLAWDKVRGQAHIGLLEPGYPGTYVMGTVSTPSGTVLVPMVEPHPDLKRSYRSHFMPGGVTTISLSPGDIGVNDHATHVAGIISAQANNGNLANPAHNSGVAGGCWDCSLTPFPTINNTEIYPGTTTGVISLRISAYAQAIQKATESGMQIINWSGQLQSAQPNENNLFSCPDFYNYVCDALAYAKERDVLIVEAVGNERFRVNELRSPVRYAAQFSILPVGGTEIANPVPGTLGSAWIYQEAIPGSGNLGIGTNFATVDGVVGPAKSIVSTITANSNFIPNPGFKCGDSIGLTPADPTDQSGARYLGGYGDGIGSCTGTSMAAPHVSALAGLVRSVNPRMEYLQVMNIIRQSGNLAASPPPLSAELGYGLPNAFTAVNAAIATNVIKLTPLFSFYSNERQDSFYTTVPHMANAALDGSLKPRNWNGVYTVTFVPPSNASNSPYGAYGSAYGNTLGTYWKFPRNPFTIGGVGSQQPLAQVWVFTTHENPKSASVQLEPLVRMSWKCGDWTPPGLAPTVCNTFTKHVDSVMVNQSETAYFQYLGYQVDGTEGYVYPKTFARPAGTVRLMRKYNRARDDFAVFPDTALATMQSNGYTEDGNLTDWLGYVYPNVNGNVPTIQ